MELTFDPRFRVNGEYLSEIDSQYRVIFTRNIESNWLAKSSQFDSYILRIPGLILVSPVTQLFRSKWLHFFIAEIKTSAFSSGKKEKFPIGIAFKAAIWKEITWPLINLEAKWNSFSCNEEEAETNGKVFFTLQ